MQLGFAAFWLRKTPLKKPELRQRRLCELDDTIVDAQLVAATRGQILDHDQARAELAYERAVELAPNSALAHDFYGILYLSPMGRHEEAIAELRRAVELDPVSVLYLTDLGWVYYMAHQYDLAIEYLQRVLELESGTSTGIGAWARFMCKRACMTKPSAHAEVRRSHRRPHRLCPRISWLRLRHGGPARQGMEILETLQDRAKRHMTWPYAFAPLYVGLGDHDKAIEALWRDYEEHSTLFLLWLKVFPVFDPLHSDPRFIELLRKIGVEPQ